LWFNVHSSWISFHWFAVRQVIFSIKVWNISYEIWIHKISLSGSWEKNRNNKVCICVPYPSNAIKQQFPLQKLKLIVFISAFSNQIFSWLIKWKISRTFENFSHVMSFDKLDELFFTWSVDLLFVCLFDLIYFT